MSSTAASHHHEVTKHQTLVLNALAREVAPASAYTLLDQLRDAGLRASQQMYRALEKLIEYGLVHRVESLNAYVACAHPHDHQHGLVVFAIYDQCSQVNEFPDLTVERRLKTWSNNNGFHMHTATDSPRTDVRTVYTKIRTPSRCRQKQRRPPCFA